MHIGRPEPLLIFLPHLNFPERVTDLQARRKTLIELADDARANAQAAHLGLQRHAAFGERPQACDCLHRDDGRVQMRAFNPCNPWGGCLLELVDCALRKVGAEGYVAEAHRRDGTPKI
jgi:hypothetical protein